MRDFKFNTITYINLVKTSVGRRSIKISRSIGHMSCCPCIKVPVGWSRWTNRAVGIKCICQMGLLRARVRKTFRTECGIMTRLMTYLISWVRAATSMAASICKTTSARIERTRWTTSTTARWGMMCLTSTMAWPRSAMLCCKSSRSWRWRSKVHSFCKKNHGILPAKEE